VNLRAVVIPFVKASACGNDFLLIDSSSVEGALVPADLAGFTQRICDRHEGAGADGVEWMYSHASADLEIRLINADGSAAEISGNGTRCVAAYVCAERQKEKVTIQTGAGLKTCLLTGRNESEYEFEVEMVITCGKHDIEVRFFERGVGETQSSGTGSCASAVAAMALGRAESPVRIHTPGGTQTVRREGDVVFLRGTARLVCRGEFFLS
jgi:diaminopimelate epimerase